MPLSSAIAIAVQFSLMAVIAVTLLRGARGLRWLRVEVVGCVGLLLDTLLRSLDAPRLVDAPVVLAVAGASFLVAIVAAGVELRTGRRFTLAAVVAGAVLTAGLLLLPEGVRQVLVVGSWVAGTLHLAWLFQRGAAKYAGSLLEARLRLLAATHWLLAAVALGLIGGTTLFVWILPIATALLLLVVAVAPPPFLRLAPTRTRAVLRRAERGVAGIGSGDRRAVHAAVEGVAAVFGADAALLVDDDTVVVAVGDPTTAVLGHQVAEEVADMDVTFRAARGGRRVLAGGTGRGAIVAVLPAIGVLLSPTDRELVGAIAERFGIVLAREGARRADERAVASRRAADRMRDDMLSTLSHELRTPLTTILGFADLLRAQVESMPPEQSRELLDRIMERGLYLEAIVSALMDLTAIRGRSEPERIAVYELRALVDRAVVRGRDLLLPRPVEVLGEAGLVLTDGGAVLAVLRELFGNIAKFTPGTAPVTITLEGSANEVSIDVTDGGPGLEGMGPEVFEPFIRGGDVLTREAGGVGVGLTIARALANQLDGTLVVVPNRRGATFRLLLARRHHLAPATQLQEPLDPRHAEGDPTLVPSGRRGDGGMTRFRSSATESG